MFINISYLSGTSQEHLKQNICASQELLVFTFPTIVGLSFFSSIRRMPRSLRGLSERIWKLSRGSPFPDQLQICYDGRRHGTIKPSEGSSVTREQLVEVNWKLFAKFMSFTRDFIYSLIFINQFSSSLRDEWGLSGEESWSSITWHEWMRIHKKIRLRVVRKTQGSLQENKSDNYI